MCITWMLGFHVGFSYTTSVQHPHFISSYIQFYLYSFISPLLNAFLLTGFFPLMHIHVYTQSRTHMLELTWSSCLSRTGSTHSVHFSEQNFLVSGNKWAVPAWLIKWNEKLMSSNCFHGSQNHTLAFNRNIP